MEFLSKVSNLLDSAQAQIVVFAMILEFTFRMVKTEKPKSIAYLIADFAKKSGEILVKFGQLLDKVLPQRLK